MPPWVTLWGMRALWVGVPLGAFFGWRWWRRRGLEEESEDDLEPIGSESVGFPDIPFLSGFGSAMPGGVPGGVAGGQGGGGPIISSEGVISPLPPPVEIPVQPPEGLPPEPAPVLAPPSPAAQTPPCDPGKTWNGFLRRCVDEQGLVTRYFPPSQPPGPGRKKKKKKGLTRREPGPVLWGRKYLGSR